MYTYTRTYIFPNRRKIFWRSPTIVINRLRDGDDPVYVFSSRESGSVVRGRINEKRRTEKEMQANRQEEKRKREWERRAGKKDWKGKDIFAVIVAIVRSRDDVSREKRKRQEDNARTKKNQRERERDVGRKWSTGLIQRRHIVPRLYAKTMLYSRRVVIRAW